MVTTSFTEHNKKTDQSRNGVCQPLCLPLFVFLGSLLFISFVKNVTNILLESKAWSWFKVLQDDLKVHWAYSSVIADQGSFVLLNSLLKLSWLCRKGEKFEIADKERKGGDSARSDIHVERGLAEGGQGVYYGMRAKEKKHDSRGVFRSEEARQGWIIELFIQRTVRLCLALQGCELRAVYSVATMKGLFHSQVLANLTCVYLCMWFGEHVNREVWTCLENCSRGSSLEKLWWEIMWSIVITRNRMLPSLFWFAFLHKFSDASLSKHRLVSCLMSLLFNRERQSFIDAAVMMLI